MLCGWDEESLAMKGQIGRSLAETGVVAWGGRIRKYSTDSSWWSTDWPRSPRDWR